MKNFLYMSVLVIAALLIGGLIGDAVQGAAGIGWLGYAMHFAFDPGTFLNLEVLTLTFGVSININVAQILLILIVIIVYYNTAPKLIKKS